MPLYEYQCQQCKDRVEIIQKMSDPLHAHCAKCGGDMKKLFSSPAIQFRGSGFYKTDYASPSSNPGSTASGTDSSSGSGSTASGTDSSSGSSSTPSEAKTKSDKPSSSE